MTAELIQFPGNFRKSPQQAVADELSRRLGEKVEVQDAGSLTVAEYALTGGPTATEFVGDYRVERDEGGVSISSLYEPIYDCRDVVEPPADCPA